MVTHGEAVEVQRIVERCDPDSACCGEHSGFLSVAAAKQDLFQRVTG